MRSLSFSLSLFVLLACSAPASSQTSNDWITGLSRQDIHVKAWPGGKKVAVCFVLYVEVWGHDQGPNFRPDMNGRKPDIVDEAFRQYAINWGLPRVGRLFNELKAPVTLALNAQFPEQEPEVWKELRGLVPHAPIVAHGLNNSTDLLPLAEGPEAQRAYIRQTIDMIQKSTGVRSIGWSSPSVYPNADTYAATAAVGIRYSLDGMDSDVPCGCCLIHQPWSTWANISPASRKRRTSSVCGSTMSANSRGRRPLTRIIHEGLAVSL
jgi:allantoinase